LITTTAELAVTPHEACGQQFLRYLRFGFLAWDGTVAQIARVCRKLVDAEHRIYSERFNRMLAVYSAPVQDSWRIDIVLSL